MGDVSKAKVVEATWRRQDTAPVRDEDRHRDLPADLKSLYRRHWKELNRYVAHTFGSGPPEPEDVVQIAFTRYAALENPERVQNARAFLFTMVRNIVLDYRRSEDRADRYVQDALVRAGEEALDEISPERVLMERQRFDTLNVAMKKLPVKQQQILAMSRYHGMTYEEIASRTGWSLADISRQIVRALAALDEALQAMEKR